MKLIRYGSSRALPVVFGRIWADAALKRGDKVVATVRRRLASISDLKEKYCEHVLTLHSTSPNQKK
jgi:hypothetical protein